jgi:hypothetical protein
MDAELIVSRKREFETFIVEIVVWRVPDLVLGSNHPYKYRLFFGTSESRIVGFDNERGKGDHKHVEGQEFPYDFVDIDTLLADFDAQVNEWRASHANLDSQN